MASRCIRRPLAVFALSTLVLLAGPRCSASRPPPSSSLPRGAAFATLPGRSAVVGQRPSSAFLGRGMRLVAAPAGGRQSSQQQRQRRGQRRGTGMSMFLGQDSGILGVGAPEIAVIVLVGYFILGPTELYKLTKEIGKTLQNFRSLSTEASKSFESTMEDQLELNELRKAQQELTDAFSFRRSINTDESLEAFEEKIVPPTETAAAAAATAGIGDSNQKKKKKIKRRRVKKQQPAAEEANGEAGTGSGEVPDLDMTAAFETVEKQQQEMIKTEPVAAAAGGDDDAARLREERKARLAASGSSADSSSKPDWFDDRGLEDLTYSSPGKKEQEEDSLFGADPWAESKAEEQDRFASQLSGQWNESVLQNEDKLQPLAKIMERLAILEEEKNAADLRLEEEFRLRGELEEKYYKQRRELLEEAAAEVQAEAYAGMGTGGGGGGGDGSDDKKKEEKSPSQSSAKGGDSYLGSL